MSGWGMVCLDQDAPKEYVRAAAAWNPIRQPEPPKEQHRHMGSASHVEAGNRMLHARDVLLEGLEQAYVLESAAETRPFLRLRPAIIGVLVEALSRIREVFGEERIKAVRLVRDDSGITVFGIIFWPDSAESGEQALARFDQSWWLRNCNRAGGIVNFNIELV